MEFFILFIFVVATFAIADHAKHNGRDYWLSVVISLVFTPLISGVVYLAIGKKKRTRRNSRSTKSKARPRTA